MTPPKNNNPEAKPPDENGLRLLIDNNMLDHANQLITTWGLQYKIIQRDGKNILEDSVVGAELWLKKFVTEDPETIAMKADANKLAKIDDEVLILGETGTGKELIARAMIGDRQNVDEKARFLRVNCAAMPKELIESELFGHKAGSFTGATGQKQGLMAAAKGGVLFLDEVGDLPLDTQAKLLNALQPVDGKRFIRPVGSNDEVEITCRVVCATHRDLKQMVKGGQFRIDLYARISTFVLNIKPLSKRTCDIKLIVNEIGYRLKQEAKAKEFLATFHDMLVSKELDLSLNVRSLEQYVKRYCVLGKI